MPVIELMDSSRVNWYPASTENAHSHKADNMLLRHTTSIAKPLVVLFAIVSIAFATLGNARHAAAHRFTLTIRH